MNPKYLIYKDNYEIGKLKEEIMKQEFYNFNQI